MVKYVKDEDYTLAMVLALDQAKEHVAYEAKAAVLIANHLGISWQKIGDALGVTKQGASQLARRGHPHVSIEALPPEEFDRICRLLGIGDRVERWEVRQIVSGKPGVSRVVRERASGPHLSRDVAERYARRFDELRDIHGGSDYPHEVWRVPPSGKAVQVPIRPVKRPRPGGSAQGADF